MLNYITNFRSACQEYWVLYHTAGLCEYAGARNFIGQMTHKIHTLSQLGRFCAYVTRGMPNDKIHSWISRNLASILQSEKLR